MHDWTPSDVVTIIAALSAFAVSIINALKNTQAKTRADDNQERLSSLVRHVQSHDQQLTTLALSIPAGGIGTPAAPNGPDTVRPNGVSSDPTASPTDLIAPQGADAEAPQ